MMAMPARSASRTQAKATGAPSIRISPVVGGLHAGEDLHQRRLAGAVLAHERVDLAGAEVEVDAVERGDAGEALGDAEGAQEHPRRRMSAVLVMPAAPLPKCRRSLLPESRQSTS